MWTHRIYDTLCLGHYLIRFKPGCERLARKFNCINICTCFKQILDNSAALSGLVERTATATGRILVWLIIPRHWRSWQRIWGRANHPPVSMTVRPASAAAQNLGMRHDSETMLSVVFNKGSANNQAYPLSISRVQYERHKQARVYT